MQNKLEQLIEYIINDDEDKAKELFHNIVVEKSREIYNELVAEESEESEGSEGSEGSEEGMEESFMPEMGGDATDDMMGDIAADEVGMDMGDEDEDMGMGDEEGSEEGSEMGGEDLEDRVVDLEDALDELKAEFERLMSDEEGSEEGSEADEAMPEDMVREYTEKVSVAHTDGTDSKGSKSPVAGKNDMGGSAKNLVQGGEEKGGSAPKAGDMGAVDPRAAGKTAFAKKAPAPVAKDAATGTTSPVAK